MVKIRHWKTWTQFQTPAPDTNSLLMHTPRVWWFRIGLLLPTCAGWLVDASSQLQRVHSWPLWVSEWVSGVQNHWKLVLNLSFLSFTVGLSLSPSTTSQIHKQIKNVRSHLSKVFRGWAHDAIELPSCSVRGVPSKFGLKSWEQMAVFRL